MNKKSGFTAIEETLIADEDGMPVKITPGGKFRLVDPESVSEFEDKEAIEALAKEYGEGPFVVRGIKWHPTDPEVITAIDSSGNGKEFEIKTSYATVYYGD